MKRFVFIALLLCFSLPNRNAFGQTKETDEVIKIDTNLVSIPVGVNDRNGRYIPNLTQSDFTVYQDGAKQDISFFAAEEEPLNVALLLDTSKSTQRVLGEIRDAAKDFVKLLKPNDRAMIVTFDYRVNNLSPLTADQRVLRNAINNVDVGEYAGTVLRDAVAETIGKSMANLKGRKAIILLTDGKDPSSETGADELLKSLEESDVLVYTIFYDTAGRNGNFGGREMDNGGITGMNRRGGRFGRRGMGGIFSGGGNFPNERQQQRRQRQQLKNEEAKSYLSEMSELTAGRFYEDANIDLGKTFALIADELKKQYRIGYYPKDENASARANNVAANKDIVHHIKVKVARSDVAIRARLTFRMKGS